MRFSQLFPESAPATPTNTHVTHSCCNGACDLMACSTRDGVKRCEFHSMPARNAQTSTTAHSPSAAAGNAPGADHPSLLGLEPRRTVSGAVREALAIAKATQTTPTAQSLMSVGGATDELALNLTHCIPSSHPRVYVPLRYRRCCFGCFRRHFCRRHLLCHGSTSILSQNAACLARSLRLFTQIP